MSTFVADMCNSYVIQRGLLLVCDFAEFRFDCTLFLYSVQQVFPPFVLSFVWGPFATGIINYCLFLRTVFWTLFGEYDMREGRTRPYESCSRKVGIRL